MKSEPVTVRKPTPASPATARGEQRLAGSGGADQQDALGDAGADLPETFGHPQEVDHLGDLLLHASYPAMSSNVVDGLSVVYAFALLLLIDITLPICPTHGAASR